MDEREIYNYLKNTSVVDIIKLISTYSGVSVEPNKNIDVYYTVKDLIRLYPNVFSKFKIDKYIKEDNLPVIKNGKDRLFLKSSIEEWLKHKSELQYGRIGF